MGNQQRQGASPAKSFLNHKAAWLAAAGTFLLLSACGGNDGGGTANDLHQASQARKTASTVALPSAYATVTQQLYIAYFGRPADASGLTAFEAMLAKDGAPTDIGALAAAYAGNPAIQALVNSFSGSAEAQALYGGNTTAQFVTSVYQNVLGRAPAEAGLTFWTNAIDSGQLSKGDAALAIMAGALGNTTAAGQLDAQLVNNRIAVASEFTTDVSSPTGLAGYRGAAAAQSARTLLSAVTASTDLEAYSTSVDTLATAIAANTFYISVTVSGLGANDSLVLQNGADSLSFSSNTSAKFAVPQINGSAYSVSTASLPPEEECDVTNGNGTGGVSSPANVSVSCHNIHVYVFYNFSTFFAQYALQPDYSVAPMDMATVPILGGDAAVIIDGKGQHAYLGDHNDNVIEQLSFDANRNLLPMTVPSVPSDIYPYQLVMDPQSRYLYAIDEGTDEISQYAVGVDGGLTPMNPPTVNGRVAGHAITIEPSGKYLYVAGLKGVGEFSIGSSGALIPLSATVATTREALDVQADRTGKYVYVAQDPGVVAQYAIGSDGTLSLVASVTADSVYSDDFKLFIDPAGKYLYAVPRSGSKLYQFAIGAGGGLTPLETAYVGTPTSMNAVGMDPSGRYIFGVDFSTNTLYEYGADSTGTMSLKNTAPLANGSIAGAVLVY